MQSSTHSRIYIKMTHYDNFMEPKIITLVEKAKEGDTDAFSMLYQIFYPKMKGICIKILQEDKAVVDDLVQDAFILALTSIKNLKNSKKFSQWLTSITTNLALKYKENTNKAQIISLDTLSEETTKGFKEETMPKSAITYDRLMSAIEELPEGYKKIFKMYVLDGMSHQEIAAILNIAPHTSSSQLARAKNMLRDMLGIKTLAVIILALIGIPVYKNFLNKKTTLPQEKTPLVSNGKKRNKQGSKDIQHRQKNELLNDLKPSLSPRIMARSIDATIGHSTTIFPDTTQTTIISITDSVGTERNITKESERNIAKNDNDTIIITDSIIEPMEHWHNVIAENYHLKKKDKWNFMALGSLGTAIVQSTYKMLTGSDDFAGSDVPSGPDQPTGPVDPSGPKDFTTWEDYAKFLHRVVPKNPTQENVAMEEIADHNQGEIIEAEHHDKPITFGIAVNKSIGGKFSLETGLKYSFLKSDFRLGTGNYHVDQKQKLHYLGIPLKLSYQFLGYKKLSAYGSAGITLHIPIFGKTKSNYITDGVSTYTDSWKVTAPVQWTTSTSLGIQYQLVPNVNLFAEPTLNWYIPTGNNVKNAWTERPFIFTMPLGIRFTW